MQYDSKTDTNTVVIRLAPSWFKFGPELYFIIIEKKDEINIKWQSFLLFKF